MYIYVSNSDFSSGPDGGSPSDAVNVFDFDMANGAFRHVQTINGLRNPGYFARHPQLPIMYLIERWIDPDHKPTTPEQMQRGDCVRAFAISAKDGTLSEIDRCSTGGQSPMHLSIHPSGNFVAFANPGRPWDPKPPSDGIITVLRLKSDGKFGDVCASEKYHGRDPVWRHRPKPYPHNTCPDPSWKRLFICFLMLDRVLIYKFDDKTGALTPSEQPYVQTSSGSGPRHAAMHPSGKFFYTTNEFDATVSAFSYDSNTGACAIVQTASFHPAGFNGKKNGAHIVVGPSGRFLYCSNRSYQSISVFAIDENTGELSLVAHRKSQGDRPRDFVFDPSGRFLLVTNQNGNTVVSFHVDPVTGDLNPTGHSIATHAPNCVVFGPT